MIWAAVDFHAIQNLYCSFPPIGVCLLRSQRELQRLAHFRCLSIVVQPCAAIMPEHYILGASACPIGWGRPRDGDPGESGKAGTQWPEELVPDTRVERSTGVSQGREDLACALKETGNTAQCKIPLVVHGGEGASSSQLQSRNGSLGGGGSAERGTVQL